MIYSPLLGFYNYTIKIINTDNPTTLYSLKKIQPAPTNITTHNLTPRLPPKMAPGTARSLTISSQSEDLSGLVFRDAEIPQDLKDREILVELRAASLNYRDLVLATVKSNNLAF
jgi:hypothetical protein